ncbi:heat-inducible transcriptional repressor HrcA [Myceligenerans indicum]|uniref:Heat-inducible transcription repressor HrcA n=1 Tax=Myceligenerans indicum TaxID=2593663 RepID=A0ABS1LNS9_9MICO|nr:heat-inducible transcriptional repressor HrcA [Myceligenerans indicum]MBL0887894.1 heat-inducible transcriptional repressor HrcA [Myceligenerans indicum]
MSDQRRLDVLRAIVEDYVHTQEPVGSRVLTERHRLGVSPATVRNDMAALEDAGYIAQPHTSAGRIPTDKGYRLFVDRLSEARPLSQPQKRAIEKFLSEAVDLDDVIGRAGRLIAQLTGQVAVVQYPSLRRSGLRHLELVPTGENRLLVVVITDNGRVEQRFLEVADEVDEAALGELRARLNAAAAGRRLTQMDLAFSEVADVVAPEHRALVAAIGEVVSNALDEEQEERLVVAGQANLARAGMGFDQGLSPLLEALEEQVVLLGLLTEMTSDENVAVSIGHENRLAGLARASVVSTGYGTDGDTVALLSSIGPTRMDYPGTIAAVRAVARYLSRVLPT